MANNLLMTVNCILRVEFDSIIRGDLLSLVHLFGTTIISNLSPNSGQIDGKYHRQIYGSVIFRPGIGKLIESYKTQRKIDSFRTSTTLCTGLFFRSTNTHSPFLLRCRFIVIIWHECIIHSVF